MNRYWQQGALSAMTHPGRPYQNWWDNLVLICDTHRNK